MRNCFVLMIATLWCASAQAAAVYDPVCNADGPIAKMEVVVAKGDLPAFRAQLRTYAAGKSLQYYEYGPFNRTAGALEGKMILLLETPIRNGGVIKIQLDVAPQSDALNVGLTVCNSTEDWQPYWNSFRTFVGTARGVQKSN